MSFTNYEFPNVSNYDSDLREILYYFKKLYHNYNAIYEEFQNIKAQFLEFQKVIDALPETIKAEVTAQLTPLWDELIADIDARIAVLSTRIDNLAALIDEFKNLVSATRQYNVEYTDIEVDKLRNDLIKQRAELEIKIDAIVKEIEGLQWELPRVYDITRGVVNPLVAVLYNVYDATRVHAITAGKYDTLGLSAQAYDAKAITALDFDTRSVWLLICKEGETLHSPFTGMLDSTQNIIDIIALHLHDDTLTAEEYDALSLTAESYANFAISAYDYDFHGASLLNSEIPLTLPNARLADFNITAYLKTLEERIEALENA